MLSRSFYPTLRAAMLALVVVGSVQGCVLALGGAALGGAVVATDRRSTGIQLEDTQIELRVSHALDSLFTRESVHIDVTSYDQQVLLAGEVPTEQAKRDAEASASSQQNVKRVINELWLGSMSGLNDGNDDIVLAAKVKAALLDVKGLSAGVVKTRCTLGRVYLMGKLTHDEAELAKDKAAHVPGVKRVVALFEILSPEEIQRIDGK
jgi:osmotically-inducible protein OsmY